MEIAVAGALIVASWIWAYWLGRQYTLPGILGASRDDPNRIDRAWENLHQRRYLFRFLRLLGTFPLAFIAFSCYGPDEIGSDWWRLTVPLALLWAIGFRLASVAGNYEFDRAMRGATWSRARMMLQVLFAHLMDEMFFLSTLVALEVCRQAALTSMTTDELNIWISPIFLSAGIVTFFAVATATIAFLKATSSHVLPDDRVKRLVGQADAIGKAKTVRISVAADSDAHLAGCHALAGLVTLTEHLLNHMPDEEIVALIVQSRIFNTGTPQRLLMIPSGVAWFITAMGLMSIPTAWYIDTFLAYPLLGSFAAYFLFSMADFATQSIRENLIHKADVRAALALSDPSALASGLENLYRLNGLPTISSTARRVKLPPLRDRLRHLEQELHVSFGNR
jgi:hypothetical protein